MVGHHRNDRAHAGTGFVRRHSKESVILVEPRQDRPLGGDAAVPATGVALATERFGADVQDDLITLLVENATVDVEPALTTSAGTPTPSRLRTAVVSAAF